MTFVKRFLPLLLLAGDALALLLFVYVGQRDHELINEANPFLGVLTTAVIFAAPWVVAGWRLGAFPTGEAFSLRDFLARSLNTWLVAAPLGVLLRAYVLGRAVVPTAFITASLGFGGVFILGWRLVFGLIWWWLSRKETGLKPA